MPFPSALLNESSEVVIDELEKFLRDSLATVRSKSFSLIGLIGLKSTSLNIRHEAIAKLISGLRDSDSGVVGTNLMYLARFASADYFSTAKDSLASIASKPIQHFQQFLKLFGRICAIQRSNSIRFYSQPPNPQPIRWAALLALSRMDDEAATNSILTRVKKLPVNDDVVYEIFPDLIYTRQRTAFDYIITELHNDTPNCTSADNDNPEKIPCGYRIMEMLAPVIKDYPVTLDVSGDIRTTDYREALTIVRAWFKRHAENYEIITEGR